MQEQIKILDKFFKNYEECHQKCEETFENEEEEKLYNNLVSTLNQIEKEIGEIDDTV